MKAITYSDKFLVESYSSVLSNLNFPCKVELMERLIQSLKNQTKETKETKETTFSTSDFIPEKSAEQIITDLRNSRSFGNTRIIEPF